MPIWWGPTSTAISLAAACSNIEAVKPKKTGARSLVKCLVCGEIFDSSLEICPVCGVGKENFVPVEAEENSFSNNTKEYYVILGNGTPAQCGKGHQGEG